MAKTATKSAARQDPVGQAFGDRLRSLREQGGLTLEQLSKLSGVSRAMLSQVERGGKSPTIGIAKRIAHALGASFSSMVGDEGAPKRAFAIVRKAQRQVFRDPETGFERYLLSPLMAGMPVEVVLHHLPPRTSTGKLPAYPSGVTKHVVVSRGRVLVGLDNVETALDEGDSLYFEVNAEHWFENRTGRAAEYYLIISAAPAFPRRSDSRS
ncbi:MAG TPA: XRE family transcriptional regulator [Caulobacteraceae bacterium]|jgi:transcriptional regulator with XRE-family HTH domain|nr:XRE family transcriptional regulator [Caulobacteraceae bacterium]